MIFFKKIFGNKNINQKSIAGQDVVQDMGVEQNDDELPDTIDEAIKLHCAIGDEFSGAEQYEKAIGEYNKAWDLIPEPKEHWHASTWVLAAIADVSFLRGDSKSAREALEFALFNCPDAVGNPFLHLRYGQISFDAGELDRAADELMRAYMGGGKDIFANEDGKYFSFLQTRADGI